MMLNLDMKEVTVLTGKGTDRIAIKFKGLSPYPSWLPDSEPVLQMDVTKGYGISYCIAVFGVDPKVIQMV